MAPVIQAKHVHPSGRISIKSRWRSAWPSMHNPRIGGRSAPLLAARCLLGCLRHSSRRRAPTRGSSPPASRPARPARPHTGSNGQIAAHSASAKPEGYLRNRRLIRRSPGHMREAITPHGRRVGHHGRERLQLRQQGGSALESEGTVQRPCRNARWRNGFALLPGCRMYAKYITRPPTSNRSAFALRGLIT